MSANQRPPIEAIELPVPVHQVIVEQGHRGLAGFGSEGNERKAFGLIGAVVTEGRALIMDAFPLTKNARYRDSSRHDFDALVCRYGVPSETAFERRGWLADPQEVTAVDRACEGGGSVLFGAYHMHRVPWAHDYSRQECSELDRQLAEGSWLWVFILSMVEPARPVLRAFYEGSNALEVPIHLLPTPDRNRVGDR